MGEGNANLAHYGAALLAGWWFAGDNQVSGSVGQAMADHSDLLADRHRDQFDFDVGASGSGDPVDDLVEDLGAHIDRAWAIGHDVIFTTLAVRTLQERPEHGSGRLVEGLHGVIAWCRQHPTAEDFARFYDLDVSDASADEVDLDPATDGPEDLARCAFDTMLSFTEVYRGAHQGNVGHVMDHAQALIELERLGFPSVARKGWQGFREHVASLRRLQPLRLDLPRVEEPVFEHPCTVGYWKRDLARNEWAYGHAFKYPYHMMDLLGFAGDEDVALRVQRQVGRLI